MRENDDLQMLFDQRLDVDEQAIGEAQERNEEAIVGDQFIAMLGRENWIALAKGTSSPIQPSEGDDPGRFYLDVPLVCVAQPHPECRFRWVRLIVDLTPTPEARIQDMAPREVRGEHPVELKTTVSLDLKFVSAAFKPERTDSRTVYYPEIVSAGPGFARGYWDFLALAGDYLHVNRELRLLLSAPTGVPVQARFSLRARVTFAGVVGMIPMLARGGAIEETYRLD